jgi:hypothetical protein
MSSDWFQHLRYTETSEGAVLETRVRVKSQIGIVVAPNFDLIEPNDWRQGNLGDTATIRKVNAMSSLWGVGPNHLPVD